MRTINYLLLTLLMCLMSSSMCSPEPDPSTISVSTSSVSFDSNSGFQTISVSSNTNWNVSGGESWLTVTPTSGSGNSSIMLSVKANKDFTSKNCTLTISTMDGEASEYVSVIQEAAELKLSVDVNELNFSEKEGDLQHLTISSNSEWKITGKPEWLDLSSASGSGNSTINLKTNSFNNSSSVRQETLLVTANGKSLEVKVTQKAGLVASCEVELDDVVILSDAVAFNMTYGSSVSYFYVGYLDKSDAGRMTDDEIIEVLDAEFVRYTPSDDYVLSFPNLESLHDYIIYTVAYDKNGKRGKLIGKEIRTKSGTNQPFASVGDVEYDASYWYWDIAIGAYSSKYYQWVMTGTNTTNYWEKNNAIIAWRFAYNIKNYPESYKAILQSGSFKLERNSSIRYIQIVTWGVDGSGNFAGIINNQRRYIKTTSNAVLESASVSSRNVGTTSKVVAVKLNDLFEGVEIIRVK